MRAFVVPVLMALGCGGPENRIDPPPGDESITKLEMRVPPPPRKIAVAPMPHEPKNPSAAPLASASRILK